VTFRGFPAEAIDFYERLQADNSRSFWQANKDTYEAAVKRPMEELCAELADYGQFHIFRPYNDLRFAKNRPPYKTAQGAATQGEGGTGFYVQISADGLMAGAGYYMMAKDQLERFRAAVDDEGSGTRVAELVDALRRGGYEIGAHDVLKTAPRGVPKDHPRITLLRHKGLMGWRSWPAAKWLHTRKAADRVRSAWEDMGELCKWIDVHVGPSTLPPDDVPMI
jgi:uncharacterized protein (TIGR02453 family)